jgi:hypothetical protein
LDELDNGIIIVSEIGGQDPDESSAAVKKKADFKYSNAKMDQLFGQTLSDLNPEDMEKVMPLRKELFSQITEKVEGGIREIENLQDKSNKSLE